MTDSPPSAQAAEVERRLRDLLERFGGRVRAILAGSGLHRHGIQPEDVEQEVRIRLWQALTRESELRHPASYIVQVVRTTVIDAMRRAAARPAAAEGAAPDGDRREVAAEPGRAGFDPETTAAAQLLAGQVELILADLGGERARAVRLLLQGFTTEEIGRVHNWTEAKARNLAYRGLSELRLRLAELGYDGRT